MYDRLNAAPLNVWGVTTVRLEEALRRVARDGSAPPRGVSIAGIATRMAVYDAAAKKPQTGLADVTMLP